MMERRLNTKFPVAIFQLCPIVLPSQALHQLEGNKKAAQKINFDRRHAAKPLITLQKGDEVVIDTNDSLLIFHLLKLQEDLINVSSIYWSKK
uniref:Putative LOC101484488 [Maylandia zebra] n=1 Tax=Lepeophtheirus salmonis TaxID=72036 RepID=A0A0K2VFW9_LEPSM